MQFWNTCNLSLERGSISMFNMKIAVNLTDSFEQTWIPFTQGKDALCQVLLKLAQWFWRRSILILINVFSIFLNYLPFEKGVALHLNTLEIPLSKGALCQVWLKLAQWFWRTRKCEPRWAKKVCSIYSCIAISKKRIKMNKNEDNLRLPLDLSTKWVNRHQQKQFMNIAGIPKLINTMYIFGKLIWAGLGRVTSVSLQPCNERRYAQTRTRL